ncbi:hypothetical protein [Frigoribacterium sp. CFBP 13707]|uniref:hypothetical protein n=1 Tax=Frigoribacterium sp. CFBP 13707 TaxID=2775313 RepID=UPI0017835FFA|nr:hypothetical protein [Frigoribacterium sp. CFBP 13707]MBD8729521.1 hypothetical protein [Frigoribacterium sp. CFBP 13707]
MTTGRRGAVAGVACGLLFSVTACSAGGVAYSDLSGSQSLKTEGVPDSLTDGALYGFSTETTRLVGTRDGVDVLLASAESNAGACLLAYASDAEWVSGCVEGEGSIGEVRGLNFVILPDGVPVPDNVDSVSDNVFVREESP